MSSQRRVGAVHVNSPVPMTSVEPPNIHFVTEKLGGGGSLRKMLSLTLFLLNGGIGLVQELLIPTHSSLCSGQALCCTG